MLLRSSGTMSNPSLIIIHSLKHLANDFRTDASDCTMHILPMYNVINWYATANNNQLSYSCIVAYRIIHFVWGMTCCGHTQSHTRQLSVSLLRHELNIFVQTSLYDNRPRQKLAGTCKVLAVHNSECYMVNSKSYEHLRSMRDKSLSASCFADSTVHSQNNWYKMT